MKSSALLLLIATLAAGCAGPAANSPDRPDFIHKSRWPEFRALPEDPADIPLPDGIPPGFWVDSKACIDRGGLCISPAMAASNALYISGYKTLRTTYEADRTIWSTQRAAYELQIGLDQETIYALQPTWWDRHGAVVTGVGGFVVGLGSALTIFYLAK